MTIQRMIRESGKIVFFGGAGVSTESGIPDFRSEDGLYRQKYSVPPETILSSDYFYAYPEAFYDFYRDKMLCLSAKPNAAHFALAKLEREGKLSAVVTQNIDGLHQAAGSKKVFELHGSVHRNTCLRCKKQYSAEFILKSKGVPRCACGGVVKPDVVLYGEPLDSATVDGAVNTIRDADMLIVAGTSLSVYPAAGFIGYFQGKHSVLINRDETSFDDRCELVVRGKVGEILSEL